MANQRICSVDGCGKSVHYNGLCSAHAEKNRKYGSPYVDFRKAKTTCSVDGCVSSHKGHGFCQKHLARFKKYGSPTGRRPTVSDSLCSIPGCCRQQRTGGLCDLHYGRKRKTGEAGAAGIQGTERGAAQRYYEDIVLSYDGEECLSWPFAKRSGYGVLNGSIVSRLVCEAVNGPPPSKDHEAAHECGRGNLGCVTKNHMRWKTPKENMADKIQHGTLLAGERAPSAKLTSADVDKIRSLKGSMTQKEIAAMFDVDASTISNIMTGRNWSSYP